MAGEWVSRKIGSLGQVVTGKTPSTADPTNFRGEYPFITIPDLDGRMLIDRTARTLSERGADTMRSSLLPAGSVMMSCIATIGKCGITTQPSFTNQQINSVIPSPDVDSRLLYYVFTQLGHELESAGGGGSVYTNVSKSRFSAIDVLLPADITEQRAIAHILGTLDDRIELNRRMSKTLEAMARALFKSWFVDFDPVRAKAEDRDPGLPQPLADLFPDRLVDSELGEIPKGWEVVTLRGAFDIADGKTLPATARDDNGPFQAYGANGPIARTAEAWVDSPCIVLGKIGTCGALHRSSVPCWVTNNAFGVRAGKSRSLEFAWQSLKCVDFSNYIGGSANPYMPLKNFGHHQIVLPSAQVLGRFQSVASSFRSRIDSGDSQSSRLVALRDALLPKLISGELRVEGADRFIAGVEA